MNVRQASYTNVFVDIASGLERRCGHEHDDEIDALECSLAMKKEYEAVITYRDDDEGRWQFLGTWTLIKKA